MINGWYIEANIDSNTKFGVLKKILQIFELEDELLIKYSSGQQMKDEPNRFGIRKKYWSQLLPLLPMSTSFSNINTTKDHWLGAGAGIGGLSFTLVITISEVRIELTISTSSKEKNKLYFNKLLKDKQGIEASFGSPLFWEELPENKMSRIKTEKAGLSLYNESDWPAMNEFFVSNLPVFEKALQPIIKTLK